jgi:hypothetical protein
MRCIEPSLNIGREHISQAQLVQAVDNGCWGLSEGSYTSAKLL